MDTVNDFKDEIKSNDFSDIKKFREKEIKRTIINCDEEIKSTDYMIYYTFIFKLVSMITTPSLAAISIIIPEDPLNIIKALVVFFGALTISIEALHIKSNSTLKSLKEKRKKLKLKTSKGLDDGSIDHSDFESILDINNE